MTSTDADADTDHRPDESADPDSPAKVDSPTDLDKRSWMFVVRKTWREFSDDQCTDLAAALTYYAVLALFPAAIALTSLLGLVGRGTEGVDEVLSILRDLGAGGVVKSIQDPLTELSRSQAAGLALVLGLVGALWSASGYVGAFGRAMNRVYEIEEGRPFWKLRPWMLGVTVVLVLLTALTLAGLVVTGPLTQTLGDRIGLGSTAQLVFEIVKWPVILCVVILIVALLYYATPNIKQPKFRWISVGAIVAILIWALASLAFGLYVAHFSSYDKTYGSLAGVIVFLLWLWLTNVALLFGAELDAELERGRELASGIAAEETIQLPPRDDRNIEKSEEKEAEDVKRGRELRRQASHRGTRKGNDS
jgi:membrane protein